MRPSEENGLAILGGTFDPIHIGHLILAQDAMESLGVERVLFIPAARNPLKRNRPATSDAHRIAMIRLALTNHRRFLIDEMEVDAGGPSYSIDTVMALRQHYPDSRLYWIIGSDELGQLAKWRRIDELVNLVEFACVLRPGYRVEAPSLAGLREHEIDGHAIEVSSSDIRRRVKEGHPVSFFLPQKVSHYIEFHGLYR